jgi:hypothetical protein
MAIAWLWVYVEFGMQGCHYLPHRRGIAISFAVSQQHRCRTLAAMLPRFDMFHNLFGSQRWWHVYRFRVELN